MGMCGTGGCKSLQAKDLRKAEGEKIFVLAPVWASLGLLAKGRWVFNAAVAEPAENDRNWGTANGNGLHHRESGGRGKAKVNVQPTRNVQRSEEVGRIRLDGCVGGA